MSDASKPSNPDDRGQWTSASNAEADALCAGRHLAQRGLPEEPETDVSVSGTLIHMALFTRNTDNLSVDEFKVYKDIEEQELTLIQQAFGPIGAVKASVFRERRLWLNDGEVYHSGKPDVVYVYEKRAVICEYKTGWGEVEKSPRNQQTRDQAVLVMVNMMGEVEDIICAVIQPSVSKEPVAAIYRHADLIRAHTELIGRIHRSNDPDSLTNRTAGRVQCAFCRAKVECLTYQRWASQVPMTQSLIEKPLAKWTADDMYLFEKNRKAAQDWLDMCHNHIKTAVAKNPNDFETMAIRPGAKEHPVRTDKINELYDRFLKLGGTQQQFMDCMGVGKSKFEKVVAVISGLKGKSLDNLMDALYKDLTFETQKEGSLVFKKGH